MYSVVINRSYGGFALSEQAKTMLLARGVSPDVIEKMEWSVKYRHHPELVFVVQTLGDEANSLCSKLTVVPVDGLYQIQEYDGFEHVITPKDMQWIDPAVV